jgi:hypothetical protein
MGIERTVAYISVHPNEDEFNKWFVKYRYGRSRGTIIFWNLYRCIFNEIFLKNLWAQLSTLWLCFLYFAVFFRL